MALQGKYTTENYPDGSKRVRLSETDPSVVEAIEKAKTVGLAENDEQVRQLLKAEEEYRDKVRRQEKLFEESIGRIVSFAVGTLEDKGFVKKTEVGMDLRPGSVQQYLDRYQVVQRIETVMASVGENPDKSLQAYVWGGVVQAVTGADRISRSTSQWGISDTLLARRMATNGAFNVRADYEAPFFNYRRESQGVWGTLLSLKFRQPIMDAALAGLSDEGGGEHEFMVREKLDVVAGTSGMGILKTVMDMVPEGAPIVYANTTYFELLPKDTSKIKTDEEIKAEVFRQNTESMQPLTVVLQPYSSSPGNDANSLEGFLNFVKKIEGGLKRPINLVIDATMVPVPVNAFKDLIDSPELKNVKMTAVWSLIKHGQMGLDMTQGAVAVVYGGESKALREQLVKNNGFISEECAARLVPHSLDTMTDRMRIAGENAETVYNYLRRTETAFGLYGKPTISDSLEAEYGNKPGIMFVPVHPSFTGLSQPSSFLDESERLTNGTSYGFDKTRVELIPDINGVGWLRVAAGQEGPLAIAGTLAELGKFLDWSEQKTLNDFEWRLKDVGHKALSSAGDERLKWLGFSEDDEKKSKVLLLAMVERFENLPPKAQEQIRKSDFYHELEPLERYAKEVNQEELTKLIGFLCKPLMNLKSSPLTSLELRLEIEKKYPGLDRAVGQIPVDEQGEVDTEKVMGFFTGTTGKRW